MKRAHEEEEASHSKRARVGRLLDSPLALQAVPIPPPPLDPALAFDDATLPLDVLLIYILPHSTLRSLHAWSLTCRYMASEWPSVVVTIPSCLYGGERFFKNALPRMRNVKSIMDFEHVTYYLHHLPDSARVMRLTTRGLTFFNTWPWSPAQRLPYLERLDFWFAAPHARRRPEQFTGLTALRELRIRKDGNTLDGDRFITQLGGMSQLTKLVIDQSTLTTDAALQYLTGLCELKLMYKAAITDAGLVARAPTLTRLVLKGDDVDGWRFTAAGIGALTRLRMLKIDMIGSGPAGLGDAIGRLTSLRTLSLYHTAFLGPSPRLSFLSCLAHTLEIFSLARDFSQDSAREVATLTRLKELRLIDYWPSVNDFGVKVRGEQMSINAIIAQAPPSVESLVLRGECVRLAHLSTIVKLTQLRSLRIGLCRQVDVDRFGTYKELVQQLPRLTVYTTDDGD